MSEFNPAATVAELRQRAINPATPLPQEAITPAMRHEMREQLIHALSEHDFRWHHLLSLTNGIQPPAPAELQEEIRANIYRLEELMVQHDEARDFLDQYDEAWLDEFADLQVCRRDEEAEAGLSMMDPEAIMRRVRGNG